MNCRVRDYIKGSSALIRKTSLLLFVLAVSACVSQPPDQGVETTLAAVRDAYFAQRLDEARRLAAPLVKRNEPEALYYAALIRRQEAQGAADYRQVLDWLQRAADQGFAPASWEIGRAYENGWGVDADLLTAIDWYRQSRAQDNDRPTQISVISEGRVQTPEAAMGDLIRQAETGDPAAQLRLAKAYDEGVLTSSDRVAALRWYLASAENGYPQAMLLVGYFYCRGVAGPTDRALANQWLTASGRQAHCR